jgi:thioesterase domain-containing protein
MAAKYLDALRSVFPDGSYLLGGFSSGGIVAYEMAQQLQRQREQVPLLVLLDTQAPQLYTHFEDEVHNFMEFGYSFGGLTDIDIISLYCAIREIDPEEGIKGIHQDLQLLSQRERLNVLLECARRAGKLMLDTGIEYLERIFAVYSANADAILHYHPQPYTGRIVLIRALDNPSKITDDRTLGWERYASNIEVYDIPGNHFSILRPPYVRDLAKKIMRILARI